MSTETEGEDVCSFRTNWPVCQSFARKLSSNITINLCAVTFVQVADEAQQVYDTEAAGIVHVSLMADSPESLLTAYAYSQQRKSGQKWLFPTEWCTEHCLATLQLALATSDVTSITSPHCGSPTGNSITHHTTYIGIRNSLKLSPTVYLLLILCLLLLSHALCILTNLNHNTLCSCYSISHSHSGSLSPILVLAFKFPHSCSQYSRSLQQLSTHMDLVSVPSELSPCTTGEYTLLEFLIYSACYCIRTHWLLV